MLKCAAAAARRPAPSPCIAMRHHGPAHVGSLTHDSNAHASRATHHTTTHHHGRSNSRQYAQNAAHTRHTHTHTRAARASARRELRALHGQHKHRRMHTSSRVQCTTAKVKTVDQGEQYMSHARPLLHKPARAPGRAKTDNRYAAIWRGSDRVPVLLSLQPREAHRLARVLPALQTAGDGGRASGWTEGRALAIR
jgi:hypothetical protein